MLKVVWAVWNPWPNRPRHPRVHGRAGRLNRPGVEVEVVELGPFTPLERRLAATVDAMGADVLVADANPIAVAIAAARASATVGVPYLLWQDEPWPADPLEETAAEERGNILSGAAAVVLPCESQRAPVLRATAEQAACHVVPAAIEPAIASAVVRTRSDWGQGPVIVHTGRLHEGRVDRLSSLADSLQSEAHGVLLAVEARLGGGPGPIRRLEELASRSGSPLVTFEAQPGELASYLDRADLAIWPSDDAAWDGDPGPALDALSRGTPVAVEGHGDLSNTILRAGAGVSFDLADPVWSAGQLAAGVRNPTMRTAGRRAARRVAASESWQPETQASNIARLLERVVGRRRRKSA